MGRHGEGAHQVVGEGMQQQDAAYAYPQPRQAAFAGLGVDAFGRGGALWVDRFGRLGPQALAPGADRRAVALLTGVGIGVRVFRLGHGA